MFKTIGLMIKEGCQDNATGKYSHSRIIAMLVSLASTIFMWKLIVLGGMNIEYFIAYLAYGTGYQTMNKFLDNRDTVRNEQFKGNIPKYHPDPSTDFNNSQCQQPQRYPEQDTGKYNRYDNNYQHDKSSGRQPSAWGD